MMKIKIFKKFISLILAGVLLFQPVFGVVVLAEGEQPSIQASNEQTQNNSENSAEAQQDQSTAVTNENNAQVENNISVTANTGGNEIEPPQPTSTSNQEVESISPTPSEPTPTPQPEVSPEEITPTPFENLAPSPTPAPEISSNQISTESGVLAENENTGENSQNIASASTEQSITVINDNQAELDNIATVSAETGSNETEGNLTNIQTSEATAEANLVNVVNTNLVGADFWQAIINVFSTSDNDIDLTQVEGFSNFDPALISVLAQNGNTGDGSVNIALASLLSQFSVYNNNSASLTNNIDLSASTGGNQIAGDDGLIQTGNAAAEANLFNLVNTNIIGSDWFFGIFNFFEEFGGDLILPYELQYLYGDALPIGGPSVLALNDNPGADSSNEAFASSLDQTTVTNNNEAAVTNKVDVSANSGGNTIVGNGSITTGDTQTLVNILNIVNTNIVGSRWLLLAINNFGGWNGNLINWWGNTVTIGNTTYAWVRLPAYAEAEEEVAVAAVNANSGIGSTNQALAGQLNSLTVENNNRATVLNNVAVSTNTGDNNVEGGQANITTGNAGSEVNILNVVNTNIFGNHWFFGMINIFDNFLGDIIFPRPDLSVTKNANRETVAPGEEITYTVTYRNQGRLWAKDVVIEDVLPAGVTFVSADNGGVWENGKVIWRLGKVISGAGQSVSVTVRVNGEIEDGTILVNQVSISTSTCEPSKDNNRSTAEVLVVKTSVQPTPTPAPDGEGGVGGPREIGGGGPSAGPPAGGCVPPEAPKAPRLLSAVAVSSTEIRLTWETVERADHYLISYGISSGNYIYGNPDVGNTTSYVVGGLASGRRYYFVVSAGIKGDCPVAGPNSNELSAVAGWVAGRVLGIKEVWAAGEGELGGGISTEVGEVAGASTGTCPFWWIVLIGQTLVLGGYYGFLLRKIKSPRFWWAAAPALVALSFLVDRYAHTHWYEKSQMCSWELLLGVALASVETAGFKLLKRKAS